MFWDLIPHKKIFKTKNIMLTRKINWHTGCTIRIQDTGVKPSLGLIGNCENILDNFYPSQFNI